MSKICNTKVIISLEGRIDSSNAYDIDAMITKELDGATDKDIVFDASKLDYISSAGLRILMKVKKNTQKAVSIEEVSPEIYEILDTTGFTQLLTVSKRMRRISVDGCKIIGSGFYGTVYRLDADTIIKVYSSPESLPMIENEKRMAKMAFLKGIPTAISYDIVRVGDSYGSVFELLNAKTFNDLIIEQPDEADDVIKAYADLVKQVHETKMEDGELPSAKRNFLGSLDVIREYLNDDRYERLKELIGKVDEEYGVVHGDLQMKNVMMTDNEPMLIDMDTLSAGNPIFDLAGIHVTYKNFNMDDPDNSLKFLGISKDMCDHIWDGFIKRYSGIDDEKIIKKITDKIRLAAAVRFLYIIAITSHKNGELGKLRIEHTLLDLDELMDRVDDISIHKI